MAQVFTKALLSGSTNGKGILVTGTSTGASVTVHTAVSGTTSLDEIWIWAMNNDTVDRVLTIEWGETTATNDTVINIPTKSGRFLIIDGRLLQNSLVVTAFAAAANVIVLDGFVNKVV
jgi:hypothetical protein